MTELTAGLIPGVDFIPAADLANRAYNYLRCLDGKVRRLRPCSILRWCGLSADRRSPGRS